MNRLEMERRIQYYSRQMPHHTLIEVLHYLDGLNRQQTSSSAKRFNTMKVPQVKVCLREELHER